MWQLNPLSTTSKFSLNTKVNQPHSVPAQTLSFVQLDGGTCPGLVTCGKTKAKLWRLRDGQWEPLRSFTHLGQTPRAVAQSADLSILAVAFGSSITLWNAKTTAMIAR